MLSVQDTILAIVDVQGKLAQMMHEKESLFLNLQRLIKGARIIGIPILWCEQNPARLGPTVPEIAELLQGVEAFPKMSFSCVGCDDFLQELANSERNQVLLAGIETHVCIYLTVVDLIGAGYEVEVVADAVSSRTAENKQIGLNKIAACKGGITCTETALFELLETAESPKFKEVAKLLK